MKKIIFLYFFWAFLFLFQSCENEDISELETASENVNPDFSAELVEADELQDIQDAINETAGKSALAWSHSQRGGSRFWLDRENAIKVTDSAGNRTYSLKVWASEPSPTVFYNLVATKRKDGRRIGPFVIKYEMGNGDRYGYAAMEDKRFQGSMSVYSLSEFARATGLRGKGIDDELVPCAIGESGSTSTGGGSVGGGGTSYYYYSTTGSIPVRGYGSGRPGPVQPGWVEVGTGVLHMPSHTAKSTGGQKLSNDLDMIGDCPEGELLIPINDYEKIVPPSCKSFNFKNKSSNWQEASVINIRFNVFVIEIIGGIRVRKKHPIYFSQPVKFGMPRKFANGATIPSGLAAEIGARAINHAIDDVISKYYNLIVNTTSVVRSDFQTMLKHEFREMSNGGRVNFNDMSQINDATQYKTYGIIPDNCY